MRRCPLNRSVTLLFQAISHVDAQQGRAGRERVPEVAYTRDKVKAKHMIYTRCEANQPRLSARSTNAETQNKSYNLCMTDSLQGAKLLRLPQLT